MRPIDADALFEAFNKAAWFDNADRDDIALELVLDAPTIDPPPNDPLALEELREMDGEPVYIKRIGSDHPDDRAWALVDVEHELCKTVDGVKAFFEFFGKSWLACRRKPEEDTP